MISTTKRIQVALPTEAMLSTRASVLKQPAGRTVVSVI